MIGIVGELNPITKPATRHIIGTGRKGTGIIEEIPLTRGAVQIVAGGMEGFTTGLS